MLYSKDANKKYTTMCKEFDEEFYTPNRDDNKLFGYMYLVFYMLACKSNYFPHSYEDYDGYAKYAATTIYTRYIKYQRQGKIIKSLLNYAKSCKGHLKTDYQKEVFQQVTKSGDENVLAYIDVYRQSIQNSYFNESIQDEVDGAIKNIKDVISDVVDESPYRSDKVLARNIYMSCLLTLLSSVTLKNSTLEKIDTKSNECKLTSEYLVKQYQKERLEEPILWNLDYSYRDTILLLVSKIRSRISDCLNDIRGAYTLPDDIIDSIIANSFKECHNTDNDGDVWSDD